MGFGVSRDGDVNGGCLLPLWPFAYFQRHSHWMDSLLPHFRRLGLLTVHLLFTATLFCVVNRDW